MSVGVFVMIAQNSDVIRKLSSYGARPIFFAAFVLTARQYGAFVLAGAASGQSPVTPRQRSHKTVTVQGGHGAVFGVLVQIA